MLLGLWSYPGLAFHSIDVSHAYLNGDMDCEVYMAQPEGFVQGDRRDQVCLLERAIYGSKQGGNRWNKKMCSVLECMAFKQSYSDGSIYINSMYGFSLSLPCFVYD